jgi:DNA-binding IclR family transcriptional regulator
MMTPRVLAPYILRLLAAAQRRGRPITLQDLVDALEVRRVDVRQALTAMDEQGLVDVLTMRLTLQGFALGSALRTRKLPAIPRQPAAKNEGSGETTLEAGPPSTKLKRVVAA